MIGHLRVKSPWSQLGLFLGLSGVCLVITSFILAFVIFARGIPIAAMSKPDWSEPGVMATMKIVQAVSSVTLFLLPAMVFGLIAYRDTPFYFLGFRAPEKRQMYLLGVLCVLIAIPFVIWLGDINQRFPLPGWMTRMEKEAGKQIEMFLRANSTSEIILNVFIIAFLPAFCEELFFRGVLQNIIVRFTKNPLTGIVLTAILFSAAHLQFQGFLPRMFLGVILGALYWYSGSIWTDILAHFVYNGLQVVVASYSPEYISKNPSLPVLIALLSGVAALVILWIYRSLSGITYQKVFGPGGSDYSDEFLV